MHIKKGDTVKVLSGEDKGKTGKILEVFPGVGKVVVDGVNMKKKHQRPRKQGEKGQVVEKAMPIFASKVMNTETKPKTIKATKKTTKKAK